MVGSICVIFVDPVVLTKFFQILLNQYSASNVILHTFLFFNVVCIIYHIEINS